MHELEHVRELLVDFGLRNAAVKLDDLLEEVAHTNDTFLSFVDKLLTMEEGMRKEKAFQTRLRKAKLSNIKTMEEFDFSFQPSINSKQVKLLETLAFVERGDNLIILGPPGVGKTHLATAFVVNALQAGKTAAFQTLPKLIDDLTKVKERGTFERRCKFYTHSDILVVDEIGYMQLNREQAEMFFRIVCARYETGSMILTSNKDFSEWGALMSDNVIATAILDRLLHHSHVINIKGESYRLKDRLRAGLNPTAEKTGAGFYRR